VAPDGAWLRIARLTLRTGVAAEPVGLEDGCAVLGVELELGEGLAGRLDPLTAAGATVGAFLSRS
jgi:hypothetical protein